MQPDPSNATIVICTRDRPVHLRACLESLRAYLGTPVMVVDNAPTSDVSETIAREFGAAYLLESVPGLSRARNAGLRAANTELVVFLDDDALPCPGWLHALLREFSDPKVMTVSGKVIPFDDESEVEGRLRGSFIGGDEWRMITRDAADWFQQANFGALGIGANMAFRRNALQFWQGFDERLDRGTLLYNGGDVYAFSCLVAAGYAAVYTPEAVVRHPFAPVPDDQNERRYKSRAAFTGYVTFLLFENPEQWRGILQYLWKRLSGTPIPWRKGAKPAHREVLPFWRVAQALASGPLLYFRQRLRGR